MFVDRASNVDGKLGPVCGYGPKAQWCRQDHGLPGYVPALAGPTSWLTGFNFPRFERQGSSIQASEIDFNCRAASKEHNIGRFNLLPSTLHRAIPTPVTALPESSIVKSFQQD